MTKTDELRQAAITQADDLLEAIDELDEHTDSHPSPNEEVRERRERALNHARDRAERAKRGLTDDWPE